MRRGASHVSNFIVTSNKRRSNRDNDFSYGEKKNHISKIQTSFLETHHPQEKFIQKEFPNARNKLNQLLKEYTFVRVLEIKYMSKTDSKHEFFYGKCETISNSLYGEKTMMSKILFFDKAGRNKHETLNIGPCKLVDCAWGKDHASGRLDVGDILVGIQIANPRSGTKLDRILTSWSKQGKILLDVSRMVEHGTKASMEGMRNFVQQKQSDLALQAQTFPSTFFHNSMGGNVTQESLKRMASCKDDMYVLLSIVLWGNIRPLAVKYALSNEKGIRCKDMPSKSEEEFCSQLIISEKPEDFITLLSSKLEDPSIISEFYAFFDDIVYPISSNENLYVPESNNQSNGIPQNGGYGFSNGFSSFVQDMYGSQTPIYAQSPKYVPSSPVIKKSNTIINTSVNTSVTCDLYSPESPVNTRVPSSPPFFPKSPLQSPPRSPLHSPPHSPLQSPPHSPLQSPPSPESPPHSPSHSPPHSPLQSPPSSESAPHAPLQSTSGTSSILETKQYPLPSISNTTTTLLDVSDTSLKSKRQKLSAALRSANNKSTQEKNGTNVVYDANAFVPTWLTTGSSILVNPSPKSQTIGKELTKKTKRKLKTKDVSDAKENGEKENAKENIDEKNDIVKEVLKKPRKRVAKEKN